MNMFTKRLSPLYCLALLLSLQALMFYGLPLAAVLVFWLLLAAVFLYVGGAQAMLTAVSMLIFTLLLNAIVHFGGLEASMYYRPHELMKTRDQNFGAIYRPNTELTMTAQFGDMEAMDPVGVKEPHEMTYKIDSLGFRNPSDYHGQEYVLVGDSFVAGFNDTQSCMLNEWLRREHQLDTYNLGFTGDMDDYMRRVKAFRKLKGDRFKVALFVFEGNDFWPYVSKPYSKDTVLKKYYNFFKDRSLWRYTRWLYLRIQKSHAKSGSLNTVKEIGGKPVIFLIEDEQRAHNEIVLKEDDLKFTMVFQELKPNLKEIFFVPVKYRVYADVLQQDLGPNERWNYLAKAATQAGIPVHDLTPVLSAEAKRILPQGDFVYWRDDSHWNCNGMRVAAKEVARVLSKP